MSAQPRSGVNEALLESLAVSRGGKGLRAVVILGSAIPIIVLMGMPWLFAWLAALMIWNSLLVPWLERRVILPALDRDPPSARLGRAGMVLLGLSLSQALPLAAWIKGDAFAAAVAVAWALSAATQVFVYYSRDRLLLACGIAPITVCALVGPAISFGLFTWQAAAASMVMLLALTAGLAFVGRSDKLIAQAAEDAAARRTAEAANSAKSRFIASMHHELRTPLNAIIGYSEMLRENAQEEGRSAEAADLDRVLAAARLQLMMIGDLLAFSELQDGRLELELHDFDAAALARETAAAMRTGIESNGNRLVLDIGNLGSACSDPAKLRHCLEHLLSNAGKFTRDGVVTFSASSDGGDLVFVVADTGVGIAPERQRSIFEPFAQTDHGAPQSGAGLGLAITTRIARLLGGSVGVASELGCGAKFTLRVRENMAPVVRGAQAIQLARTF